MKERIFTPQELLNMDKNEWANFNLCIRSRAYRLLGIKWEKWISVEKDIFTDNIVFRYE